MIVLSSLEDLEITREGTLLLPVVLLLGSCWSRIDSRDVLQTVSRTEANAVLRWSHANNHTANAVHDTTPQGTPL